MNIGLLIPIRLASERLPGKALQDICGKPAVCHLLDRCFNTAYVAKENVVVCTTHDSSDDPLVEVVQTYGGSIFRGSRDDILHRFNAAINEYDFDAVIQVDGDDILTATEYMDLTLKNLLADSALDIVTCSGLPLGIACKSFTRQAMQRVMQIYKTKKNDTGFIYYFTKSGLFKQKVLQPINSAHVHQQARLTLDYPEDLQVFREIFAGLYQPGEVFDLTTLVKFLHQHPEICAKNLQLEEEYWLRTQQKAQLEFVATDGEIQKLLN